MLGIEDALPQSDGREAYVVEYKPHEDAPVVWGRIVAWMDVERGTPYQQEFYDEDGEKLRRMTFSDTREVAGRYLPHLWQLEPLDKEGHSSTIAIDAIELDADFGDDVFTTRNLESRGRRR